MDISTKGRAKVKRKIIICIYLFLEKYLMKNLITVIFSLFLLCLHPQLYGQDILPDSLLTKDHVYKLTYTDTQKAKQILDLMRQKETIPQFLADIVEGDLYFNTGKYRQALIYYKKAMDSDSVRNNSLHYMDQLQRLISCYDVLNNVQEKTVCINLLMEKANECNDEGMESIANFNMGKTLYYQEDKERAYEYINKAIASMKRSTYKNKYDHIRYEYNSLLIMQKRDKLYEQALQTIDSLQAYLLSEGDVPFIEGLNKLEEKNLYAHKAVVLFRLKKESEAAQYYRKWKSMGVESDKDNYLIMPYLFGNEMYDDIIELNSKQEQFITQYQDTISYYMVAVKRQLAKAYWEKGNFKKSAFYFEQLATLGDSINVRKQRNAAIEYATIYETQEKKNQIQIQKSTLQRRNILLLSTTFIVILLLFIVFATYSNMQKARKQNQAMIRQIKEMQSIKNECIYTENNSENINKKVEEQSVIKPITRDLHMELCRLMNEEKIYLNPKLTRDELVLRLNTNKNTLTDLLKKNTGLGFSEYINSLRLNDSLRLLDNMSPNDNIEYIAEQVGFSKSTFYRLFKDRYGMTPSEYRNLSQNNK